MTEEKILSQCWTGTVLAGVAVALTALRARAVPFSITAALFDEDRMVTIINTTKEEGRRSVLLLTLYDMGQGEHGVRTDLVTDPCLVKDCMASECSV